MPLSRHFSGHGEEVMSSMRKTYGKDAKSVFYATENARKKGRKRGKKRGRMRVKRRSRTRRS